MKHQQKNEDVTGGWGKPGTVQEESKELQCLVLFAFILVV